MILIIASQDDPHAEAVAYGLKHVGVQCLIWDCSKHLSNYSLAVRNDAESGVSGSLNINGFELFISDVKVVWFRASDPIEVPDSIGLSYKAQWLKHASSTRNAIFFALGNNGAIWINDWERVPAAENKFIQLSAAVASGFKIPESMLTDQQNSLRDFQNERRGLIYKPWNKHKTRSGATAIPFFLRECDFENSAAIEKSRRIYQEYISMSEEVRLFVFPGGHVACRIDGVLNESTVDRYVAAGSTREVSKVELPQQVIDKSRETLEKLGLRSGSFDLAKTAEGEYQFIEANQRGQFLWMEYINPNVRVLAQFVQSIAELAGEKCAQNALKTLTFRSFHRQYEKRPKVNSATSAHIY